MFESKKQGDEDGSGGKTHTGGSAHPVVASPIDAATLPNVKELLERCDELGIDYERRPLKVTEGRELRGRVENFERRANEIKDMVSSVPSLQVEELPSRPLTGGPISRLWNQTILFKWWRDVFPVSAFDVYQDNGGGSRTKLYRVTVSSKLFSTELESAVDHYRSGGELAKNAAKKMRMVLKAQAQDDTTADVGQKGGVSQEGSANRGGSTTGPSKAKSLVGALEAQELMLSQEAERLGLPRNVSTEDIASLKALAAAMKSDVRRLVSDIKGGSNSLSKRSDGRTVVSTKSYDLRCAPLSSDFWRSYRQKDWIVSEVCQATTFCGAFVSVLAAAVSAVSMSMTPFTFAVATTCLAGW